MKVKSIIIATLALLMTVSCFGQSKKYKNIYDITVKDIKWNFGKFLVSKDGKTILRFEPMVSPEGLEGAIQEMLKEQWYENFNSGTAQMVERVPSLGVEEDVGSLGLSDYTEGLIITIE